MKKACWSLSTMIEQWLLNVNNCEQWLLTTVVDRVQHYIVDRVQHNIATSCWQHWSSCSFLRVYSARLVFKFTNVHALCSFIGQVHSRISSLHNIRCLCIICRPYHPASTRDIEHETGRDDARGNHLREGVRRLTGTSCKRDEQRRRCVRHYEWHITRRK